MKQFWTVLQFELSQYLKNKAFIIVTVIGVVLIGLCMSIPSLLNLGTSSDTDTAEPPTAVEASDIDGAILVIDQTGYYTDTSLFTNGLSAQYTYQIEADPGETAIQDRMEKLRQQSASLRLTRSLYIRNPPAFLPYYWNRLMAFLIR